MESSDMIDGNTERSQKWFILCLLASIIGLITFIVYGRFIKYDEYFRRLSGKTSVVEYFSYYRGLWLYILTGSAMLWFVVKEKVQECSYHWPLVIYSFFIVVSTVFSQYHSLAIFGDSDRHEGMLAHLCYMAIVFLFIQVIKKESDLKAMFGALFLSAALVAVVGVCQFFGYDYFRQFYNNLLVPAYAVELVGVVQGVASGDIPVSAIFSVFGNSNFAGSYMTMLFSLTMAFAIGLRSPWKFIFLPINIFIFINLVGSKSRSGVFSCLIALLILAVFQRKQLRANLKFFLCLLFLGIVSMFVMDAHSLKSDNRFFDSIISRKNITSVGFSSQFESLKLGLNEATVVFGGEPLRIKFNERNEMEFYDSTGVKVHYRFEPDEISQPSINVGNQPKLGMSGQNGSVTGLIDVNMSQVTSLNKADKASVDRLPIVREEPGGYLFFQKGKLRGYEIYATPRLNLLKIGRGGPNFHLIHTNKGFKICDFRGDICDLKDVETFGFKGHEFFASGRGYIWSRTLPLLRRCMLVGYGPDTFIRYFPNHDYLGNLKFWGDIGMLIQKPHSLYLQIFFNSGLLSLLAILALFATYLWRSAKLYFYSSLENFSQNAGLAIFVAVIAYLITGIFNDSVVAVAPVFWSLLGLGIATNRINSEQSSEQDLVT